MNISQLLNLETAESAFEEQQRQRSIKHNASQPSHSNNSASHSDGKGQPDEPENDQPTKGKGWKKWTDQEDESLVENVEEFTKRDKKIHWEYVATQVGRNISSCFNRYQRLRGLNSASHSDGKGQPDEPEIDQFKRANQIWSARDDELLFESVKKFREQGQMNRWEHVATDVGRSGSSCYNRYKRFKSLERGAKHPNDEDWDPSKDKVLIQLVNGGMKWTRISKKLGHPLQECRARYRSLLSKPGP